MKGTTKVSILLLLVLSLTACNGKASGTSGSSATAAPATNESQATAHNTSEDVSSTAVSESDSSDSSPADITEDVSEPSEPVGPIGTVDHPVAVDPTPYWHGEDYFDLERYLSDCGADWSMICYVGEKDELSSVLCKINERTLYISGNNFTYITVKTADTEVGVFSGYTILNVPIWIEPHEHRISLDKSTLDILFLSMPSIVSDSVCPFAGTGLPHTGTDRYAPHND